MALQSNSGLAIIVMGVSGSGKTTIGSLLAEALSCQFLDADNYHSAENIEKMRKGGALTDADRFPWLERLRDVLSTYLVEGKQVVLACSALRVSYRDVLRDATKKTDGDNHGVVFIYLKASELITSRLEARFRAGQHYMPPSLLKSQVACLELRSDEKDIVTVDTSDEPKAIVANILSQLKNKHSQPTETNVSAL